MKVSQKRIDANRANAKRSTGPKTPEGKANASRNAVQHGLCASTFVLENEDENAYRTMRDTYLDRFGPHDQVEIDLVDRIVHANWNLQRSWNIENQTLDLEMTMMERPLAAQFIELPEETRIAAAFIEQSKKPTLSLLTRYQARQSNEYNRALNTLLTIRKNVPIAPPGPLLQNEPINPEPQQNQHLSPKEPRTETLPPASDLRELTTDHRPLTTVRAAALTTDNPQLTTPQATPLTTVRAAALTTDNRQLRWQLRCPLPSHCPQPPKALESKHSPLWEED